MARWLYSTKRLSRLRSLLCLQSMAISFNTGGHLFLCAFNKFTNHFFHFLFERRNIISLPTRNPSSPWMPAGRLPKPEGRRLILLFGVGLSFVLTPFDNLIIKYIITTAPRNERLSNLFPRRYMMNEKVEVVACIPLNQIANFRWIIQDCGYNLQGIRMSTVRGSSDRLALDIGLDKFCMRYWFTVKGRDALVGLEEIAKIYGGRAFEMTTEEKRNF